MLLAIVCLYAASSIHIMHSRRSLSDTFDIIISREDPSVHHMTCTTCYTEAPTRHCLHKAHTIGAVYTITAANVQPESAAMPANSKC